MLTLNLLLAALMDIPYTSGRDVFQMPMVFFSYIIDWSSSVKFISCNISELMRNQQIFSLPMTCLGFLCIISTAYLKRKFAVMRNIILSLNNQQYTWLLDQFFIPFQRNLYIMQNDDLLLSKCELLYLSPEFLNKYL